MIDQFLLMEKKEKLLDEELNGFFYWGYLRFNVYMELEARANQQKNIVNNKLNEVTFSKLLTIVKNCTIENPLLKSNKKEMIFLSHPRRQLIEDNYSCIYTDDLFEKFQKNSNNSEVLYKFGHLKPTKNDVFYLDYIDILPVLIKPFYCIYQFRYIKEIERIAIKIYTVLKKYFKVEIGYEWIKSLLKRKYIWYKLKKPLLTQYIKKISPKIIVEVVGYETIKMIVNEIAFENNITTVELQHGVIGKGHLAYNYGYKGNSFRMKFLPQKIFFYGEYWKDTCNFPIGDENKYITGYPYFDKMKMNFPKIVEQNRFINVLILSQPEFAFKLYALIEKLLKLDKFKAFKFIYKLHPAESKKGNLDYKKLEQMGPVEIIENNSIPLYQLFAEANIQIGITSTALFEGLGYDLPTYIYHIEKTDKYMGDICKAKQGEMFENENQLLTLLMRPMKPKESNNADPNYYFKKDALNNIVQAINNIKGS